MASDATTSAQIDWLLASTRIDAIRQRVQRDGLTREASHAFVEAQAEQTMALCEIDRARRLDEARRMALALGDVLEPS